MRERIAQGRDLLVRLTGCDFGYDLRRWHEHLKETGAGGYTWRSDIVFPKIMQEALASQEWHQAVAALTERVQGSDLRSSDGDG